MDVKTRIIKLEGDVSDLKSRIAVAEAGIKDVKEDLSSIKSNTNWILRLIIGAIVTALLGLIFKGVV